LPDAKIIHIHRDPLDTCLSLYSKLFAGPLHYAYDMGELGRYYRAYERLMQHWHQVLPKGVILDIRYEAMIGNLEPAARAMLDHVGIAWNEQCLSFHQTKREVRTASATQVRRPLYGTSVGRGHVYGDLTRPLIEALR